MDLFTFTPEEEAEYLAIYEAECAARKPAYREEEPAPTPEPRTSYQNPIYGESHERGCGCATCDPSPDPDVYLPWEQESVCGSCGCSPCTCHERYTAYKAEIRENGHLVVTIDSDDPGELESAIAATIRELNQSQHERNEFLEIRVRYI
jgi:hypothetical protein